MKHYLLFYISLFVVVCGVGFTIFFIYSSKESESLVPDLTEEERSWLRQHSENISILADPGYRPLDFMHSDGTHDGISEDFFRLIEEKLNIRFIRARASSWNDLLDMAKTRKADVIKSGVSTPERNEYMLFTKHYMEFETVIIVRNDKKESLTIKDLYGKRVALTEGYSIDEYIRTNFPSIIRVPVANDTAALKMAMAGEVDAAISDLPSASHIISSLSIPNLRIAGVTDHYHRLAIGTRKDWPLLNTIMEKAIASITERERSEIFDKWIKIEYNKVLYTTKFWNLLLITTGSVLVLLLFIFLWNRTLQALVTERTKELKDYKDHLEIKVEERTAELTETNRQLHEALDNVRTLRGIIPICSSCKDVRDDKGYWAQVDEYVSTHTDAEFTHSLCPDCVRKLYPDHADKLLGKDKEG